MLTYPPLSDKNTPPMVKKNSMQSWLEAGYIQFAAEGLEGIQVERLARITGLNKSGYYHYFGDRETYLEKLMENHLLISGHMANDLKLVQHFDPQFIEVLLKYATPVMAHNQLVRNRDNKLLVSTYNKVNGIVDPIVSQLFADFIGFKDHLDFSTRYYYQIRDTFYTQITFERMNYPFLRDFLHQAKDIIQHAIELAAKTRTQ
jgi:AcrR family transcriptional regulator